MRGPPQADQIATVRSWNEGLAERYRDAPRRELEAEMMQEKGMGGTQIGLEAGEGGVDTVRGMSEPEDRSRTEMAEVESLK